MRTPRARRRLGRRGRSDDKARLEGMIREEFDRIMETEGVTPNEAAMRALNTVRERVRRR